MCIRPETIPTILRTEMVSNGKAENHFCKDHEDHEKNFYWRQARRREDLPVLRPLYEMSTQHIETRRKLQGIPLVAQFEEVLSLCTLDEEDKHILRLHYLHNKDFRFIGDTLGYSERTIKARHKRALRKLSNAL